MDENERFCKRCNMSSLVNKFSPNRRVCIKCCSLVNNQKLKESNYYKEYYKEHRDEFIEKGKSYYNDVVKPSRGEAKKAGRPRKLISV
jgi:hypothetical protein